MRLLFSGKIQMYGVEAALKKLVEYCCADVEGLWNLVGKSDIADLLRDEAP